MLGTVINATAIVIASIAGILLGSRLNEELKESLISALGLAVILIGLSMALETQNVLVVIASMLIGTAIGEMIGIEKWLDKGANRIEARFEGSRFTDGFVSSTLLFCVGSLAIVGPIQEGLTGDTSILMAKSMLDGIAAMALSSTLGIGVLFSSVSVLIYQGFFTLLASSMSAYATEQIITEVTATGGLLITAIGIKLLQIRNLKIGNMLPAVFVAPILTPLLQGL
ncbi:MAG: DUF554 domain-containing protein [Archaeoglobaceae archaeon]